MSENKALLRIGLNTENQTEVEVNVDGREEMFSLCMGLETLFANNPEIALMFKVVHDIIKEDPEVEAIVEKATKPGTELHIKRNPTVS